LVNKNLIEVLALLALASLPTGRWFGLDALAGRMPLKWRKSNDEDLIADAETGAVDVASGASVESDAIGADAESAVEFCSESEPDTDTESESL
jgi:hypothetical protein